VTSLLVELDTELAETARSKATELGLDDVVVRTADAGTTSAYEGHVPADVLLACGVFGNITDADLVLTVSVLPRLLVPGGVVV
jgi:protein-L-isoaspartate O-methyltransferase